MWPQVVMPIGSKLPLLLSDSFPTCQAGPTGQK